MANEIINSGQTLVVSSGEIAISTTVNSGGIFNILSSGYASITMISNGGIENIEYMGSSISATIESGGILNVNSGGTSLNDIINDGGIINVNSLGNISNTTINSGGLQVVNSNGITNSVVINNGGSQTVNSGATTSNTIISSGGLQTVNSSGASFKTTINNGGTQIVNYFGANAQSTTISSGGTQIINSGAEMTQVTINGGTQIINSGVVNDGTVNSGGIQILYNGAVNLGTINSGGTLTVNGGDAWLVTAQNTGVITVNSGGSATYITLNSGASETINSGGVGIGTTINSGASQTIYNGLASATTIKSGGIQTVNGGTVSNTYISGGTQILNSGLASVTSINSGGSQIVSSGAITNAVTVNSGGVLTISSGGSLQGRSILNIGGSATIYPDAGGSLNLVGNTNGGLVISGLENGGSATTVLTVISGFSGTSSDESDLITLAGIQKSNVTSVAYEDASGNASDDYVTLTVKNSEGVDTKVTLNIIGAKTAGYTLVDGASGLIYEVCFLTGSMIKIPGGEMAVENLRIGDKVCTYDWVNNQEVVRPICWVGNKKTIVQSDLPDDEAGYPVRICKDAIASGIPYKDLLVTPEHCLFFDGKFIPVRMLVNGSSIRYDYSITEYTYYHIETEEHSVIWANAVLTESYLDTGNRKNFKQHGNFVIFNKETVSKSWDQDASASLTFERSYVEPIYHQLASRAMDIGLTKINHLKFTNDSDFHLVTDKGDVIQHCHKEGNKYSFLLPQDIHEVYLKSKTSRPCDVIGPFVDDRRQLGLLIGQIHILSANQCDQITDHLIEENLQGWDILEYSPCRWTNGNAKLNINQNNQQKRVLIIEVLNTNTYLSQNNTQQIKKIA